MLRNIFIWSILCGCGGLVAAVKVSVYYESLCPDSIRFLTTQFYPAYTTIGDQIDVDLIPYGKATAVNESGTWNFTCQHGERECYGNKFHSCAVDLFPVESSTEFVVCAMNSGDASLDENLEQCATDTNVTWATLQECVSSGHADELLAANGVRTDAVDPKITFIPTIVYNDIFSAALQNLSLSDFADVVQFLTDEEACDGCHLNGASRFNGVAVSLGLLCFWALNLLVR